MTEAPDEKQELKNALTGKTAEITQWLDSCPAPTIDKPMTEEAACFMLYHPA